MHTEIKGQEGYVSWRYIDRANPGPNYIPHGISCKVATYASFVSPKGHILYYGGACKVPGDRFVKDIGRKISLTRLLQNANLSKEERKRVWQDYHNRGNGA